MAREYRFEDPRSPPPAVERRLCFWEGGFEMRLDLKGGGWKPMGRFVTWAMAGLALASSIAAHALAEESGAPPPELVLSDITGYADFVGAEYLDKSLGATPATGDFVAIGLSDIDKAGFLGALSKAAREAAEGQPVSCVPPPSLNLGRFGGRLPLPLEDWVVTVDLSFVGRVRSLSSGWSPLMAGPAYLARVEVLDLLYVASSRFRGLTEILVLVPGSELRVGGIHLEACPSAWPAISEGGEYVFDFTHSGDYTPKYMPAIDVLPVRDGVVENPGAWHVTVAEGTTVAKLSAHAHKVQERRWHPTDESR